MCYHIILIPFPLTLPDPSARWPLPGSLWPRRASRSASGGGGAWLGTPSPRLLTQKFQKFVATRGGGRLVGWLPAGPCRAALGGLPAWPRGWPGVCPAVCLAVCPSRLPEPPARPPARPAGLLLACTFSWPLRTGLHMLPQFRPRTPRRAGQASGFTTPRASPLHRARPPPVTSI